MNSIVSPRCVCYFILFHSHRRACTKQMKKCAENCVSLHRYNAFLICIVFHGIVELIVVHSHQNKEPNTNRRSSPWCAVYHNSPDRIDSSLERATHKINIVFFFSFFVSLFVRRISNWIRSRNCIYTPHRMLVHAGRPKRCND